jgi:FkbM family methyltransferase
MKYQTIEELERISAFGAVSFNEQLGQQSIVRCRALASYWLCTFPNQDGIAEHLNKDGYWESWITQWISVNVQPGSVCIDAGATYGYYTFFLSHHGCKVYSIEANPALIPLLEYANYLNGSYDRVTILNKAVFDRSGYHGQLGFTDTIGGTSVSANKEGGILIETIALDELLMFEKRIDFVKLDISSSEEAAWKGMQRIMQSNPDCICIMEFAPVYYKNRGRDFFQEIASRYHIFYIDGTGAEVRLKDYSFFENDQQNWRMLVIRTVIDKQQPNNILTLLHALD